MEKLNFRNRRRKNAYIIDERLSQRAVSLANYMIENKSAVRQAAKVFGVSKSTVHKDLTERLENIDSSLAGQVREVLDLNKSERHIRGGMATKEKYAHMHMFTACYSYSLVASTIASIALSNQSTSRLSTSPASLAAAIAGVIGI